MALEQIVMSIAFAEPAIVRATDTPAYYEQVDFAAASQVIITADAVIIAYE